MNASTPRAQSAAAEDPFFIVGYVRSGTTLFRRMLNAHPELFVPPEADGFQRLPPVLGEAMRDARDLDRALDGFPSYYAQTFDLERFRALALESLPLDTPEVVALLNRCARTAAEKPRARWGHKEPHEWPFVYRWRRWYPNSQFLHIVRRPHDVVGSVRHYTAQNVRLHRIRPSAAMSAWHWRTAFRSVRREGRTLGPERYLPLTYEGLVAAPAETLSGICRFLGVSAEAVPAMLRHHEAPGADAAEAGAHMAMASRPVSSEGGGRGEARLSARELAAIDHICRAEIAELGYESSGAPAIPTLRALGLDMLCLALAIAWGLVRLRRRLAGRL
jgi:hypothetical protein